MTDDPTPVFDASSVAAVLLDDDAPELPALFDGHVLDLTVYEVGNVLWKIHALQERTTAEEHAELVSLTADLQRELVVHDVEEIDFETVLDVATTTGLTVYDAGYLACAEHLGTELVTEDRELRQVASGRVETCEVRELE